jgi:hypothetical protein
VIAWLDRLQSSVRSHPGRSSANKNPFQQDAGAPRGNTREGGGESGESDEEQTPQQHAPPCRASSDSDDTPLSPNTLVDSDIDPYPDDSVPIGLLAKLAISTSGDAAGQTERTRGDNANAEDEDVVRIYSFVIFPGMVDEILFCCPRVSPARHFSCQDHR